MKPSDPAATSYPLCWPDGWRRSKSREGGRFNKKQSETRRNGSGEAYTVNVTKGLSTRDASLRVLESLMRMGIERHDIVISTNLRLTIDGLPRGDQGEPGDPGAATYWAKARRRQCIAIDRYSRVADNLAAIAATLEAMRAIERHGGAEILERAFTGFIALPAPEQWFQVLGLSSHATETEISAAHRRLAMEHHPDRGGDGARMARINAARDEGLSRAP